MKATGIIRQIDELGRIVIPKEIRRTFRIKEGTPLEIFCGESGELILKKYSMLADLKLFASEVCSAIFNTLNLPVILTDKDNVLCAMGTQKNTYIDKMISTELDNLLEKRKSVIFNKSSGDNVINLIKDDITIYFSQIIVPIISNGDVIGSLISFTKEQKAFDDCDLMALKVISNFLAVQFE